ncbi:MAG: divergent polysaccharide deacetylase family protein [Syntrophales bacterium]|nr:divergent polysaccharide deacetylase family protein [Syntrophales bacterium]MDY0044561.1 divergent polysaccharide deacetylase family protein [Syntrophales bacterium]
MKKKKKRSNIRRVGWIGICIIIFMFSAQYLFNDKKDTDKEESVSRSRKSKVSSFKKMAIVIDDIGYNQWAVDRILHLDVPITLSVIPYSPYSEEAARKSRQAGKEVILHIPMEPHGYPEKNPGQGALFLHMSKPEIEDAIQNAIDSIPFVTGANNHMGSRFMECEEKLAVVFSELKKRGMYFLDSCTTPESKAKIVASAVGVPCGVRDVFIDNNQERKETVRIIRNLIKERNGWETIIAIGHPYDSTLAAVEEVIPDLRTHGIKIVALSEIIKN